jgi:2-keto-4-pentenoate hydratase/2-oxohepta-3-ene-1,7-dioic acid hydratase in catechol pathway
MKLATFLDDTRSERVGVVRRDKVHPFTGDRTMRELIELGPDTVQGVETSPGLALADVRLLPPLRPASIRDFVAFEEHVEGVRRSIDGAGGVPEAWYDAPTFYFTNPHTVIGPDEPVPFPAVSVERDFELEVAAVVGRPGRSLTAAAGADAIFGYTILNDWSARDLQRREMQVGLGPAKGKDFATTLGPWIVTADELDPFLDDDGFLRLTCAVEVNGAEIGRDLLSNMGWSFGALVAYASRDSWVVPGDVLGSGTTGNGGCLAELWGRHGRKDPPPLGNGDTVTLTVEGIGSITNFVTEADPAPRLPAFRPRSARVSG